MPSREKRALRRQRGIAVLTVLVVLTALIAAALIALLCLRGGVEGDSGSVPVVYPENPNFVDQNATAAPLVLSAASATVAPSPTPSPSPEPSPTPTADDGAPAEGGLTRFCPTARPGDYFLPIFDRARRTENDEMMIAITVDRCDKPEVLAQMVEIARRYNAKLTLFPTGDALMNESMQAGFRSCVRSFGYEIENCSYSAKSEYQLSNGEMSIQLWKQSIAVSYVLGADYQQHFFRPHSAASAGDQRTHYFLGKLGLLGVATYTYSTRESKVETLIAKLANGNIYQFDMTQKSLGMFETLIAAANQKGYKFVTLNELFGLEEDVIGDSLTIDKQELPSMDDYLPTYYDLKLGDGTNSVYALQRRLAELGYLRGESAVPDGFYGPNTSTAVSVFQAKVGITATGNADVETQQKLFADDAPSA